MIKIFSKVIYIIWLLYYVYIYEIKWNKDLFAFTYVDALHTLMFHIREAEYSVGNTGGSGSTFEINQNLDIHNTYIKF